MEREEEVRDLVKVRDIESKYVQEVVGNLPKLVEKRKREIGKALVEYSERCKIKKRSKKGEVYEDINDNPIVIQNFFFKSINPISSVEPEYNAEELGIVWDLYIDTVSQINMQIGTLVPSLSNFCSFAGIRLSTFKRYRSSEEEAMRIVVDKIDDVCFSSNITMSQLGKLNERSTIFRMKSEQEKVEKERPVVHVHTETVDLKEINKRLLEIKRYNDKKKKEVIEVNE